jgi:hypothetical protein
MHDLTQMIVLFLIVAAFCGFAVVLFVTSLYVASGDKAEEPKIERKVTPAQRTGAHASWEAANDRR